MKRIFNRTSQWFAALLIGGCIAVSCVGNADKAVVPSSFDGEALLAAAGQLDELIAIGDIAELAGIPAERIARHVEDYDNHPSQKKLAYHWEAPGAISFTTLTGEAVNLPKHHSIGIANLEAMDLATFERRYLTSAGIKAAIDALVNDTSVNADVAIAQTAYLADVAKNLSLEQLEGVGEAAVWELPTQVLHVFADGAAFTVTTNFGDDSVVNKRKAIAFARMVFNNQ